MGTIETLASKLADDTLKAQKMLGDDRLFMEVSKVLGAASQSLEEAFLTECRVRLAEEKARTFLVSRVKQAREAAGKET